MKQIELPPFAPTLMESTRAIGYSLEAALADIVDNSIAADASNVYINFFPIDGEYVYILDDGKGMSSSELTQAMQYGSKDPTLERTTNDLGRFGLGLKTASLSQCRKLTVVSKSGDDIQCRQWDLDHVIETGKWMLNDLQIEEIDSLPGYDRLQGLTSGTLVVWQNLDRMKLGTSNFEKVMGEKMDIVREHLSLVFHRFLASKKLAIGLNDDQLKPIDPFLSHKSTVPADDEKIHINGSTVVVRPYILPHMSKLSKQEMDALGGKDGLRKQQGFYIYRNRRLVVWGTWFNMLRKGELSKLVRIRVDVPNTLDELWTLDIKKSHAIPPVEVKNNLRRLVENIAQKGERVWTYRGKKEISDKVIHVWNRLKMRDKGYNYEINCDYPLVSRFLNSLNDEDKLIFKRILKHIECGLPLNALYQDLTNDIKITNDETYGNKDEVIRTVKEIIRGVINKDLRAGLLEELIKSEPFAQYESDIRANLKEDI